MGDKKTWKDHFLSSGVPLEYSATRILKQLDFTAPREYRYERISESGLLTQFSVDIHTSYIVLEPNLWLDLLVECKYRHDGVRWVFTPTHDDIFSPRYEDVFVLLDQYDTTRRISRDKVRSYAGGIPMCGKGIELLLDDKNPKSIEQAVQQLRYSMVSRAVDSIVHQVDELLGTPPPIFVLLPVIITTAELWRMKPSTSIEDIREAKELEEVAERRDMVLLHTDPDNLLVSHTKDYFRSHLTPLQKTLFDARLKATTGNSLDYFVQAFASRIPSLFVVLAYQVFEAFVKNLLGFVNDNAILEERRKIV